MCTLKVSDTNKGLFEDFYVYKMTCNHLISDALASLQREKGLIDVWMAVKSWTWSTMRVLETVT